MNDGTKIVWRGVYDGRHRAPRRWQPEHTYRDAAILLGLTTGLVLRAIQDAWALEENAWAWFFTLMLIADAGLYLHSCWLWLVSTGRAMTM